MKENNKDKKIGVLDWLIFFAILIMFIMVYIPQIIWEEEDHYKKIRRDRMKMISQAEEFYYELTGEYSIEYNKVFSLVESAMDSLIADSLFVGHSQEIHLNGKTYMVNLELGFDIIVDTTFSVSEKVKKTVQDTIYSLGMNNLETNQIDTILVNSINLNKYKNDSLFIETYSVQYENRMENETNYLRKKYHLTDDLIYCPISKNNQNKKFVLEIEKTASNESVFKISSPLSSDDVERRYGIFTYNPGSKESIRGGQKSWAGN